MSQATWRVQGYGWEVDMDLLDSDKLRAGSFDPEDAFDFAFELVNKSKHLTWASTGNNDNRVFILAMPALPWEMDEAEKCLTPEKVEAEIHRILAPYLLSDAEIEFDDIDEEGWG